MFFQLLSSVLDGKTPCSKTGGHGNASVIQASAKLPTCQCFRGIYGRRLHRTLFEVESWSEPGCCSQVVGATQPFDHKNENRSIDPGNEDRYPGRLLSVSGRRS